VRLAGHFLPESRTKWRCAQGNAGGPLQQELKRFRKPGTRQQLNLAQAAADPRLRNHMLSTAFSPASTILLG